ncbi:MAG: polymer-forming cytoskeletal protein [Spirochaetales bacterium]|nr:polymer-forming cytoskeletal protein [Spirochaetales bacterium]MCF7937041.1 polymer-forming cytoskeletal protein [Spirochaetales bacterium]
MAGKTKQRKLRDYNVQTVFDNETKFNGALKFQNSLAIEGSFTGTIEAKGLLYIAEGAVVKADVKAASVVVEGVLHGDIQAEDRVEMLSKGRVFGNVTANHLKIEDGVLFEGGCEMLRSPESVNIFSAPLQQLKQTLMEA